MTKQNQILPRKELVFLDAAIDKIRKGAPLSDKDAQDAKECGFTLPELKQLVEVIYEDELKPECSEEAAL